MSRRLNFQTVAWFYDLYERSRLDLDPPYQRRSVWNQEYRDYFVDTILLEYPAPAIFLFEQINPDGRSCLFVVDGKQRLTTIFAFIRDAFPVGENAEKSALRGLYFSQLSDEVKRAFWSYQFLIEYIPAPDEGVINNIFNRINKNVARLTPQELRHASYGGVFITVAEDLTEWMARELPTSFPRILPKSRRQMKDVEFTAELLLLLEVGAKSYSQLDLDQAFSERDFSWERREEVEDKFRSVISYVKDVVEVGGEDLVRTRLRNQTDFYSLVGAIASLGSRLPRASEAAERLVTFIAAVEDASTRSINQLARSYFDAARSASNDVGPRTTRIDAIRGVLTGEAPPIVAWNQ